MASLNKVSLIGNLGADPELKYVGENAVCNLRVATTETWKDKSTGEKKEKTEWHRVTCWRELAENCSKYLSKGRQVFVEGKLETRTYDKDGQKHYATEIVASNVLFLGSKDGGSEKSAPRGTEQASRSTKASDDDIPF